MSTFTLFLYDAQDFVGGLPIEENAKAQGDSDQSVTLNQGATGIEIKVADDDDNFDEVDETGQTLVEAVTVGGVTYPAGTKVWTAYDLENSLTGHRATSVHFGGEGTDQGVVHGLVSTETLLENQQYDFDLNKTSHGEINSYKVEYVPCLTQGTRIRTPNGLCAVEDLQSGDLVMTRDHGARPVRYIWVHHFAGLGKAAPILIPAGTFGGHGDVRLSREHRVLLSPIFARIVCGWNKEVLIAAKFLVGRWGIVAKQQGIVRYWHILFDRHEIIEADGLPVETYLWTVKKSEPFGAPTNADLAGILPPNRLRSSWVTARPIIRRKHLKPHEPNMTTPLRTSPPANVG